MSSLNRMLRRIVAWGLALVILGSVGWGGWWAAQRVVGENPDDAVASATRLVVDVERRTLEERVSTRGVIGFTEIGAIAVGGDGRVTSVSVAQGETLDVGEVVMELNGRPVVTVANASPFWRDLKEGVGGGDVAALQEFLSDAGFYDSEVDGRFGHSTREAVEEWQESYGAQDPDGILMVGDTLVGEWPARVGRVRVAPGDFLAAGDEIAKLTADDPAVSVELLPSERLRITEGAQATVEVAATGESVAGVVSQLALDPVDRDGSLVYPAAIELTEPLGAPDGTLVRVTIVVERAAEVVVVPIAAVVSDVNGDPAVRVVGDGGAPTTVSVGLGMSEGAWVEVTSGLSGDESVLVAASSQQ